MFHFLIVYCIAYYDVCLPCCFDVALLVFSWFIVLCHRFLYCVFSCGLLCCVFFLSISGIDCRSHLQYCLESLSRRKHPRRNRTTGLAPHAEAHANMHADPICNIASSLDESESYVRRARLTFLPSIKLNFTAQFVTPFTWSSSAFTEAIILINPSLLSTASPSLTNLKQIIVLCIHCSCFVLLVFGTQKNLHLMRKKMPRYLRKMRMSFLIMIKRLWMSAVSSFFLLFVCLVFA